MPSGLQLIPQSYYSEFVNRGVDVKNFGAFGDNTHDDTTAIQNALNSGAHSVMLEPNVTYKITSTLTVPDNVRLYSPGKSAIINLTTTNTAAISIGISMLENIKITLPSGNTQDTACGITVRLASPDTPNNYCMVNNIFIQGQSGDNTANGIYVSGTSGSMSFSLWTNLKFNQLLNTVKVNCTNPAYFNGMTMRNIIANTCTRLLYFTGYGCTGNNVDGVEWNNSGTTTEIVWFDSASYNRVSGFFFDLGQYGSTNTVMKCTGSSANNVVYTTVDVNQSNIVDTTSNRLNYLDIDYKKFYQAISAFHNLPFGYLDSTYINQVGYWSEFKPYNGWNENVLAYAPILHQVTTTPAPSGGNISAAFDPTVPQNVNKPTWILSGTNTAVIEIDFNLQFFNTTNKRLDYFGIFFGSSTQYAQTILVQAYDRTNGWTTVTNVTNNTLNYFSVTGGRDGKSFGTDIQKLKITLSNSAAGTGYITVEQIHARLLSNMGTSFMPRGGGQLFGNIDMHGNQITNKVWQNGTTANRPTGAYQYQEYFDTTLGKPIWVKAAGVLEVDTLTISTGATSAGNITIALNGVNTTVAVAAGDSAGTVGDKIRSTFFSGWTVGGSSGSATVTFTKQTGGTNTAPSFTDTGTTGTAASFTVTTAGTNPSWVDSTGTGV